MSERHPALLSDDDIKAVLYPRARTTVADIMVMQRAIADAAVRKLVEYLIRVGNLDVLPHRLRNDVVFVIPVEHWQALRAAVGLGKEGEHDAP